MDILLALLVVGALLVYFFFLRRKGPPAAPGERRSVMPEATSEEPKAKEEAAPKKKPKPTTPDDASDAAPPSREVAEKEPPSRGAPPAPPSRGPDLGVLRKGLTRSRDDAGLFGKLKALFGKQPTLDESLVEQIEEILLASDVGVSTTQAVLERVRAQLGSDGADAAAVWRCLREQAVEMLEAPGKGGPLSLAKKPAVVLFVGVNGAGKTTTIGKLAQHLQEAGHNCVLAAGDTFRAAAVQQLKIWGKRVGCEVVHGKDGADPASVLFDAIRQAQEKGADVVLADTAGRLHTKSNLMEEMKKIARSAGKALDGAPHEILLVIDATNGQNAMAQAREFREALQLTGIVLTKLDGTAKGGVVLGISDSLGVPVRYVGLGEGPGDLHEFHARRFVEALLGEEEAS